MFFDHRAQVFRVYSLVGFLLVNVFIAWVLSSLVLCVYNTHTHACVLCVRHLCVSLSLKCLPSQFVIHLSGSVSYLFRFFPPTACVSNSQVSEKQNKPWASLCLVGNAEAPGGISKAWGLCPVITTFCLDFVLNACTYRCICSNTASFDILYLVGRSSEVTVESASTSNYVVPWHSFAFVHGTVCLHPLKIATSGQSRARDVLSTKRDGSFFEFKFSVFGCMLHFYVLTATPERGTRAFHL